MEDFSQLSDRPGHTGCDTLVGERGIKLSGGWRSAQCLIQVQILIPFPNRATIWRIRKRGADYCLRRSIPSGALGHPMQFSQCSMRHNQAFTGCQ